MSQMNISLDMDRVQSSVQAKIRPAVEAELAKVDVQKMIQDALNQKAPDGRSTFMYMVRGYGDGPPRTILENMVQQGVVAIAKEFAEAALREQRPALEDAFMRMLEKSKVGFVQAFAKSMTSAIHEGDWSFSAKVAVTAEKAERDSYDD